MLAQMLPSVATCTGPRRGRSTPPRSRCRKLVAALQRQVRYTVQKDVCAAEGRLRPFLGSIGWTTKDEVTGQARKRRGRSVEFLPSGTPKTHLPLTSALREHSCSRPASTGDRRLESDLPSASFLRTWCATCVVATRPHTLTASTSTQKANFRHIKGSIPRTK